MESRTSVNYQKETPKISHWKAEKKVQKKNKPDFANISNRKYSIN